MPADSNWNVPFFAALVEFKRLGIVERDGVDIDLDTVILLNETQRITNDRQRFSAKSPS